MTVVLAREPYTCPWCGERSTKGELSGKGFHCPRCTLELAHLEIAPNGTVRKVLGWLLALGELIQGRYRVTGVLGKGGSAARPTWSPTNGCKASAGRSRSCPRTSTTNTKLRS